MHWELAITAASVLAVAAVSQRLTGTWITPAMAFVLLGIVLGPLVLDELTAPVESPAIRTLAEATLAVVLFQDASRIKLSALRREYSVPLRLLGIGLALTILFGAILAAAVFTQLSVPEAVVLAVLLAPTDAALGQAMVTEPRLPSRIRQGLNVESGLNDGICVPLLLIALAVAEAQKRGVAGTHAVQIVAEEIGYGALAGAAAGLVGSAIVAASRRRHLITSVWLQVIPVATAALAYGLAIGLGGSGFIAAFLAGAVFGLLVAREAERTSKLDEALGDLLGGVTFLVFGALLLGPSLRHLEPSMILYAVASLTVVRMVPVAVAMLGSGAAARTVALLGWFGPRGLASIVFALIVVQEANLPEAHVILITTYLTIGLSVFAHGITAAPLALRYARWYERRSRLGTGGMEGLPTPEHPTRGQSPAHRALT